MHRPGISAENQYHKMGQYCWQRYS